MLLSELAAKFNISCFEPSDYKWLMDQYYINTSTHCDLHLSLFSCYLSFFGATVNTFVFLFTTNCYILRVYAFCACDWSDTHKTSSKPTYFFLLITSASTWANSVALKMEAAHSSETLGRITTAQCKSPKEVSYYYHFQISKKNEMCLRRNVLENCNSKSGGGLAIFWACTESWDLGTKCTYKRQEWKDSISWCSSKVTDHIINSSPSVESRYCPSNSQKGYLWNYSFSVKPWYLKKTRPHDILHGI